MAFEKAKGKVDVKVNYSGQIIFEHYQRLVYQLELKANWLIGICSVIIIMILTRYETFYFNSLSNIGELIIVVGCLFAILNLMFVLVPKIFSSKEYGHALQEVNVFEGRNILKNFTKNEFANYLSKLNHDENTVNNTYTNAIYQLVALRLPSSSRKLKIGGWTMIISLLVGTFLIGVSYLI